MRAAKRKVEAKALEEGLVTYGCRGTVELSQGDHMLFAPPLTLNEGEAELIYQGMKSAIESAYTEYLRS